MRIKAIIMMLVFMAIFSWGFALANYDGSVADSYASGTGSENDPYHINSPEQLALLAKSVNDGNRYFDKYFVLDNDIDLNNVEWTPIGSWEYSFRGIFDGNNHSVTNIKITELYVYKSNTYYIACVGLFGRAYDIQNLSVEGEINIDKNDLEYMHICVGGICGKSQGKISNCYNNCKINVSCASESSIVNVGGVVGEVTGTGEDILNKDLLIDNCNNQADIYILSRTFS